MVVLKNHFPIMIMEDYKLLTYKYGKLYLYDYDNNKLSYRAQICKSFKEQYLARVRFFARLFRLGVRTSIILKNEKILFFIGKNILEYDNSKDGEVTSTYRLDKHRPLYFTEISKINNFEDCIVYGEYKSNPSRSSVRIFKRLKNGKWDVTYTFPKGIINHIHNIVPDPFEKCVWILTGDFGPYIGIWKATNNFQHVEPVLLGKQIYRACIGFPTKEGLIYGTDTPFERNSIRILKKYSGGYISECIQEINGPVIYGCKYLDKYIFSTTVEPNGIYKSKYEFLLTMKKGDGICEPISFVYSGNINGFESYYSCEKDRLPYTLFQFGTFRFPSHLNKFNYLPVYHIGTTKNDMSTVILDNFDNKTTD